MSQLSQQETVQYLREAGFPEHVIPTMTAIAGGESGYRTRALNPRGNDLSYGPLQINMRGPLGPARRKEYGLTSNEDLYDMKTHFRVAKDIYDKQGLKAWGAYTNDSYKDFLPSSQVAYSAVSQPKPKKDTAPVEVKVKPKQEVDPQPQPKPKSKRPSVNRDVLRSLMGSIIEEYAPKETPVQNNDADIYMQAASQLYASEDPYDQELARKYELKALNQPPPELDAPTNPADIFAGLFSS